MIALNSILLAFLFGHIDGVLALILALASYGDLLCAAALESDWDEDYFDV